MPDKVNDTEKLKKIVQALPGKNCGKCGYANCGEFAVAVASDQASIFGCRQDRSAGYAICNILGIPVPETAAAPSGQSRFNSGPRLQERGAHHGHGIHGRKGHHLHHH